MTVSFYDKNRSTELTSRARIEEKTIIIEIEDDLIYQWITIDRSTAIRFAKELRRQISLIEE